MKRLAYISILLIVLAFSACNNVGRNSKNRIPADTTSLVLFLDSADALFANADYRQSLEMAKIAAEMGRELEDTTSLSDALSYVLSDYQQLGILDSAIIAANELLEIDKKMGDIKMLSNDYNNIAYIYMGDKQYTLAREFIEKAIEMEKSVEGSPRLATRYGMASEILNNLANDSSTTDKQQLLAQSLDYINKAYELEQAKGDTLRIARRLSQRADVLVSMARNTEAEKDYLKAVSLLEPLGERHSLAITYRQLGSLYVAMKKNAQAITCLEKSAEMTKGEGELGSLMKVYMKLHEAYQTIDEKQSNRYLKLYTQTKDSIYTLESARSLSEFHAKYDTDKEKEKAQNKHRLLLATWLSGGLLVIVLLTVLISLCYLLYRRNKKTKLLRAQVLLLKQQMADQQQQFLEQMKQSVEDVPLIASSAANRQFIENLNNAIFKLMGSQDVTADNIASELCISVQQLRRRLKSINDKTPLGYINEVRLGYAKQLLEDRTDLSIEQVGQLCGFYEATNFTRFFKKETDLTPSQYRDKA